MIGLASGCPPHRLLPLRRQRERGGPYPYALRSAHDDQSQAFEADTKVHSHRRLCHLKEAGVPYTTLPLLSLSLSQWYPYIHICSKLSSYFGLISYLIKVPRIQHSRRHQSLPQYPLHRRSFQPSGTIPIQIQLGTGGRGCSALLQRQ